MEDLNKTQMVLLCLLVSFVTSIGTGVITTSLLREVPQNVTQTINRVVERTVQTIGPSTPNTVTKEVTTVVVKEEDLVIGSINKSRASLVRIFENGRNGQTTFQTIGVVVKNDGTILADKRFIVAGKDYSAVFAGSGESVPVSILKASEKTNAVFLLASPKTAMTFSANSIDMRNSPQLGQTVIAIGGKEKEAVAIGRLSSVNVEPQTTASSTNTVLSVETDTPLRDLVPGSILLTLNGEIVGFENFGQGTNVETLYTSIVVLRRENPSFFETTAN